MARNLVENTLSSELERVSETKEEVVFDSAFESGNLMFVFSRTELESPR